MPERLPTYFISHGGGPWPWLPKMRKIFATLERSLTDMVEDIGRTPSAVLMVSGHWEADIIRIMASERPAMEYDYYGFPDHTYDIKYGAPGSPDMARRASELLMDAGIESLLDNSQGFDHGCFVPMAIMYPQAEVPLFQISLHASYDVAFHLEMGRALAKLRDEGVLIIGSGLSFHNLQAFGPAAKGPSEAFDGWLDKSLMLDPGQRTSAMLQWESAPHARFCHQREDHLVPLFVALGAAEQEKARRVYHEKGLLGGIAASSYRFG